MSVSIVTWLLNDLSEELSAQQHIEELTENGYVIVKAFCNETSGTLILQKKERDELLNFLGEIIISLQEITKQVTYLTARYK